MPSEKWIAERKLPNGVVVHFRHVRPDDEAMIGDAFRTASRETLLHRFFSPIRDLAPDQLHRMLSIDPAREVCIVGCIEEEGRTRIICGARYIRVGPPDTAEIALTVHDEFQGAGIGKFLLRLLTELAVADGVGTFQVDVMWSNTRMLEISRKAFPGLKQHLASGDVIHLEMPLAEASRGQP